jgi:curved DNA-binding protein CbpA
MRSSAVLDIPRDASEADIKKAFRKLSIKHHPDKGGDKELFQKIQRAYEVLSNEELRMVFDHAGYVSPFWPILYLFAPSHGMYADCETCKNKHGMQMILLKKIDVVAVPRDSISMRRVRTPQQAPLTPSSEAVATGV